MALLTRLVAASCSRPSSSAVTVDRRDPESVVRGYFDAWERSDWPAQVSFMSGTYANMAPEPADSLRVVEIHRLKESSATVARYRVVFDIKVQGEGVSMSSGRCDWTYDLTWDADRGSWLITNYGAG